MAEVPQTPDPDKPLGPDGTTSGSPGGITPKPVAAPKPPVSPKPPATPDSGVPAKGPAVPSPGPSRPAYTPPPPKRTSEQIRSDIEGQRQQLGQNVDHLRDRVTEITDWRSQLLKHRKKIVVGAVATGFVVGGLMALRRR